MSLEALRTTKAELTRLGDAIDERLREGAQLSDTPDNLKTLRDVEWLCEHLVERAKQITVIEPRRRK